MGILYGSCSRHRRERNGERTNYSNRRNLNLMGYANQTNLQGSHRERISFRCKKEIHFYESILPSFGIFPPSPPVPSINFECLPLIPILFFIYSFFSLQDLHLILFLSVRLEGKSGQHLLAASVHQ
ncbi:hypothetical protein CDAR_180471 [Caerostris darwini]|uniref:Uncharacterized protein n=1 Tax=Caerostris darwini TaxID=1538125 RepID=A0AAV4NSA4_9ARAC|nr:hypothetical protein CDAR_180471 [Caerostris darwini]